LIRCSPRVTQVGRVTIVRLPEATSKALPSRGQVSVVGTINGTNFQAIVEPDGCSGHWIRMEAGANAGDHVMLEFEPTKEWPEPTVPADLMDALENAPQRIREIWQDITPMARWEWVRWVNATKNAATRRRRVEVTISKIDHGRRRPCCFNLAACTDPDLTKNGKLIEST
jgi:uncharacterized protein YdeI (YjbR/CyaY-like superfamily)